MIRKIGLSLGFFTLMGLMGCQMSLMEAPQTAGEEALDRAVAPSWPVVKNGSTGQPVRNLQYFLKARGYSLTVDGDFGPGTQSAVVAFQKSVGLTADGIVGSGTWPKVVVSVQLGSQGSAVTALQETLKNKYGYSLTVDGIYGSGTQSAVLNYKNKRGLTGADVVGATTWQYLIGEATDFWGSRVSTWTFPVKGGKILDPNTNSRYFGASRDGGARAHAGIDLVPVNGPGTAVVAMTSGTVQNYYLFYGGTYALEVLNDDGTIARYTEITSSLRSGARVAKGQAIGTIIRNNIGGSYMLHLEVYMNTSTGGLTNSSNTYYKYVPALNFQRRSDLLDPSGVTKLPALY